ncbi:hypothetical protein BV898_08179 [Hypsibius exemplaris]|uniref:Uncharacterized protein n=1 Tax=Hypsibius exemplaris TaxID=2072580 RepID=A0A1W0WRB5_HYPEX|nr:hypothetical protein BV898_08179 [Hypsibius exemplaris]
MDSPENMTAFGAWSSVTFPPIDYPPSSSVVVTHLEPPAPPAIYALLQQLLVVIGSSLSLVFIAFAFITFTLFSDLKDLAG